jgi:hypothetical protein
MVKKVFVIFILSFIFLTSCNSDKKASNKELDLMGYGVPLKVKAPEGTEVKVKDMSIYKDITLKKGDDYFVQILSSSATTNDIAKIKEERLGEVKLNPFFSNVILDEPNGFVFEKKMNDTTFNFDFRYVKIQGDNQFTFQTGLFGLFTKEQVLNMYESIK